MSRGACSRRSRSIRPSSTGSSTSSSCSSVSSQTSTTSPDFKSIQQVIRAVFRSSKISIQQIERIQGRINEVYLTKLVDGSTLVLKCPPARSVRLLRHEKHFLETEKRTLETLHEYTQLPIPQMIKFDSQGGVLTQPFLLMSFVQGRTLSEISSTLTLAERKNIDRCLGTYVRALTALSATQFGMTHRVFAKKGCKSWREAFLALLEAVLRDAEDMLVTIPYDSVRYYISANSHFLDEVTEPRLVALHACEPDNVIIDETTKQVSGLIGFSDVIWGDPLMSGGIGNGSDAFFEGLGECPIRTGAVKARCLMYTAYRSLVNIVAQHYRPHFGNDELEARRSLAHALNDLARM